MNRVREEMRQVLVKELRPQTHSVLPLQVAQEECFLLFGEQTLVQMI